MVDGCLPAAPLFPRNGTWAAQRWWWWDAHRQACTAVRIDDYRVHDSRHSYAVRAARAGVPAEYIAQQLGHKTTRMVLAIYGRFMPKSDELDYWHARMAELEEGAHKKMTEAAG